MFRGFLRLLAVLMALVCMAGAAGAAVAQTPPLTIDDVLGMESFGAVSIDPTGSRLVYERRGAFDTASGYDLGYRAIWTVSTLYLKDLRSHGAAQPLLPSSQGRGVVLGPWSASGDHLLVYRLRDRRLEAGVVTLATRDVFWTGLTPDMPIAGAFAAWLDEDRIAMTVRPDGSLPWTLRHDGDSQKEVAREWALMAEGQTPARTVVTTQAGVAGTENPLAPLAVVIFDRRTGQTQTVAEGQVRDMTASPDGRHIAVLMAGEGVANPATGPIVQSAILERGDLTIINADTGKATRPIPTQDVAPHLLRWSLSSRSLLVWVRDPGEAWSDGALIRLGINGSVTVSRRDGLDPFPSGSGLDSLRGVHADFLGERPVLSARKEGEDRMDWYELGSAKAPTLLTGGLSSVPSRLASVTGHSFLLFADRGLWEVGDRRRARRSAATTSVANAESGDMLAPLRLRMNAPAVRDWAVGLDDSGGVSILGDRRSRAAQSAPLTGTTRVGSASRTVLALVTTDHGVQTLRLSRGHDTEVVDQLNGNLAERAYPTARPIRHLDRLGRETTSYLYLPEGLAASDVKGVIVVVYPGSVDDGAYQDPLTMRVSLSLEVIAGAGYAVLSPSMPADVAASDLFAGFARSVDLAVDAMLVASPDLPADRLAILGHSYGGYAALGIATRSRRYRSYVSWAGLSDLVGAWGEFTPITRSKPEEGSTVTYQMGWAEVGQGGVGGPPWTVPQAYIDKSPLFSADRIDDPVMLITGDRDFVPMSQAERIFAALHRRNRQARLVTYWGEGHMMWSPANARDLYAQLFAWWDLTLKPTAASAPTAVPPMPAPSLPEPPRS